MMKVKERESVDLGPRDFEKVAIISSGEARQSVAH